MDECKPLPARRLGTSLNLWASAAASEGLTTVVWMLLMAVRRRAMSSRCSSDRVGQAENAQNIGFRV